MNARGKLIDIQSGGDIVYSDKFFRENDALKEFMILCIGLGMIPELSNVGRKRGLILSGLGVSMKFEICSDPICIKIAFIKILLDNTYCMQHYYEAVNTVIGKLIDCARKYNVVLGAWVCDDDLPVYKLLGFKIIEKYDKFWVEYSHLLS